MWATLATPFHPERRPAASRCLPTTLSFHDARVSSFRQLDPAVGGCFGPNFQYYAAGFAPGGLSPPPLLDVLSGERYAAGYRMKDFDLAALIIWYVVFVLSTTFHEYAHAWVANRGGDRTASEAGLFTVHPLPHIRRSPFGMVIVPLVSFALMGWMIGRASVPFDPRWGHRYPKRQAAMSIAGPAANFTLALIALIVLKVCLSSGIFVPGTSYLHMAEAAGDTQSTPLGALAMGLSVMLALNLILGLFNLLPIPPLDGAGVAEGMSPKTLGRIYEQMRAVPVFQLIGIVVAWKVIPLIFWPALHAAYRFISSGAPGA